MAGVVAMAADQAGTRVATASLDGTVRVRDVGTGSTRILTVEQNASALLRPIDQKPEAPAWRPARGLTFDPSGRWLVASGVRGAANGLLFVWDLQAGPDSDRKPRIVRGDGGLAGTSPMTSISTIAISPNGTSLLVGLSDPILHKGALWGLFRLDFPAMTNPFAFPFTRPGDHPPKSRFLGSVRAITTLDDRSFATAIDDRAVVKDNQAEPPDFHTWVEIRQTSDGRVIERVGNDGLRPWPGPISTLAYSPKQGWLAFADADRREIVIKDVRKGWQNPNFPLV